MQDALPSSLRCAETAANERVISVTSERAPGQRRWYVALGALVAGSLLAGLVVMLRPTSPVGHWDSDAGRDRYQAAYAAAFAALPEPAETIDVHTDFGIVRVYRFDGADRGGPPLLLLPGRASGVPVWADNVPSLLKIGDIYAIDLLGEPGMSIQNRPITSDADQAAWLRQTLDALPEETFHVIGLSIGGWTAVNLALHEPDVVTTLTLIDPALVFDDLPLETIVRSLPAALPWLPRTWRDSFNSYTAGGSPVEDVPVAEMIEAGMQHYRMRLPQPERIPEERLASLDAPVLAIIAGASVMHDPRVAAETAQRALANGEVVVIPGASHAVNGEYPDEIAGAISRFISANQQEMPATAQP